MKLKHGFDQISSCPNCRVKAADLFETGLSEKAGADFAQMAQVRTYGPGEIVFAEGSEPTGVFLVDTGRVKLVRRADARPQVVKIARSGDVLGLGATLTKAVHRVTAEVLSETTVRFLAALEFHRFLKRRTMYIGHLVSYIEEHAHGEEVPFLMTAAARKVASFVLESAYRDGRETGEGVSVELPVTLRELSALLFVRSERIEDVFERFEDRRWLYRGQRTVTLLDEAALQAISRGSEAN
jgi:CRP/FNR family cyclic AMP-dependent transcriptional regulator